MRVTAHGLIGCWILSFFAVAGLAAESNDLRLVEAAKNQDKQAIRDLLQQRLDPNTPQPDGATALHWAVHWDDMESADLLIRAGASVNATDDLGAMPLSLACTNGNATMVGRLLATGANANAALASGETPLMTCARTGSVEAVTLLLAHHANVNASESWQQQTPIMWAVAQQHSDVIQTLIKSGADIRARSKNGFTPLHFAARAGGLEPARLLLAAGADVNAAAGDGSTPLLVATVRGNVPLALLLLDQGADPTADLPGFTALHWASGTWETKVSNPLFGFIDPMSGIPDRQAKLDLIKALLAKGANPNARATKNPPRFGNTSYRMNLVGATPLFLASYAADVEVIRLLVAAGADPKLPTRNKTTPLMAAAGLNRVQGESGVTEPEALEAVKLALELGEDVNAFNDQGENCLHGVAYLGWNNLLQFLVDKGAKVNAVSKQGLTPWLIAAGHGDRALSTTVVFQKDTAELLLKLGADPKLGAPCEASGCGGER